MDFMRIGLILCVLAAVSAGAGLRSHGALAEDKKDELKISADQSLKMGIEVAGVSEQAAVGTIQFLARAVVPPSQIRIVSSPVAGRLDSVEASVDGAVKSGQVLARISGPAWMRAQSELVQAIKQQQFLRTTLDREQSLSADRIVSTKQLQSTQNEFAQAQASVVEKRNTLKMSGMSDADVDALVAKGGLAPSLSIVAPMNGVVLEVLGVTGQTIEAAAPLFKLAALSPLSLEIQVPANRVGKIRIGDSVTALPDLGTGNVRSISNSVDPATQTVIVRAEITPAEQKIRPQQIVEVAVTLASEGAKIWGVKPASIIRRAGKAYVFVQTPEGFRAQEVSIVSEDSGDITVISGPFGGTEMIAVKGLVPLKGAWQGIGAAEEK